MAPVCWGRAALWGKEPSYSGPPWSQVVTNSTKEFSERIGLSHDRLLGQEWRCPEHPEHLQVQAREQIPDTPPGTVPESRPRTEAAL